MTVSIIIPNYNGEELLKKNLPKVFAAASWYGEKTGNKVEVIVSDDASRDESLHFLDDEKKKQQKIPLKIIETKRNQGFAPTVNRGVHAADGDLLVLLNSDVSPERDFLIPLLKHFSDEEVFAVGCLDRSIENGKERLRGRGVGKWERGFLMHRAGSIDHTKTLWASGGSSAFRASYWKRLGGLYEIYRPFYWEDIDLSYRAKKAGYTVLFEPESRVIHEHETGAIKQQFSRKKVMHISYRNQFLFVWLNLTEIPILLSHLLWLPIHCIQALLRLDGNFFLGFFSALVHFPEALALRRKNRELFKLSDSVVIASSQ